MRLVADTCLGLVLDLSQRARHLQIPAKMTPCQNPPQNGRERKGREWEEGDARRIAAEARDWRKRTEEDGRGRSSNANHNILFILSCTYSHYQQIENEITSCKTWPVTFYAATRVVYAVSLSYPWGSRQPTSNDRDYATASFIRELSKQIAEQQNGQKT